MRIAMHTVREELSRLGLAQAEMDQWLADDEADWKSHITDSDHHRDYPHGGRRKP
jgi:hypothetical protein